MTIGKAVPTSHANCLIQEVVLRHEPGDMLVATVVSNISETGQFAFHLYRNGGRIHVQDYSPNPVFSFGINGKAGLYLVLSYLRTPDSTPITKYSNPLFLYPVDYRLGQVFKKPQQEECTLILHGQYWKFPAVYYAGQEQQPLFVMLSNRINRSLIRLPAFSRCAWAYQKKFPGHVLCVADPTLELHEDLGLGWYLGTAEHDASEDLAMFIRRFAEGLGIPDGKIIFWGSSGGGFSALALASRIENTIAVAINAQSDAFAYENANDIEKVRRHCFGGKPTKEIQEQYGSRINMVQAWRNNRSSRVILLQNALDAHHYAYHFTPFWESLGGSNEGGAAAGGRHYAWLYSDSRGHYAPEPEQMIPEIVNLINQESFTASTVLPKTRAANE